VLASRRRTGFKRLGATDENIGERSAVNVVAGGEMNRFMRWMCASIIGPPRAARSSASIAACHSGAECLALGSLVM
jgi:hypothetical protein